MIYNIVLSFRNESKQSTVTRIQLFASKYTIKHYNIATVMFALSIFTSSNYLAIIATL